MAEIKSESVADFIPESVADLLRNQQLGEQLEVANTSLVAERQRVDALQVVLTEERRRVEDGRKRIDELHVDLADAVTAERIAAGEAAALRAILEGLRARSWWRRWFR